MGDVVSKDICSSRSACNLKAHLVAQEEGAVDVAEGATTQRVFATLLGPGLTGSVNSIQTVGQGSLVSAVVVHQDVTKAINKNSGIF